MNSDKELSSQIKRMINKAQRSLQAAKSLLNEEYFEFSVSRSYYSAFYALEAILLTQNLSFSKHSGVISHFNQHFVKTGLFPAHFSKSLARLFRERHVSDYDFESGIKEEDARTDYEISAEILHSIEVYLRNEKYIE